MKIAFISYEYPPDTAFGGIATYVYQAARMLHCRGHNVEVFCGSHQRSCSENLDGILVHRIKELDIRNFYMPAGLLFAERHAKIQFDVLEGPEFAADAREAVHLVPDIPLVVKLHTPSIMLLRLNYPDGNSFSLKTKLEFYLRSLLKRIKPKWGYDPVFLRNKEFTIKNNEIERTHARDADEVAAPSKDIGKILLEEWNLNQELIAHIPYPYEPSDDLLEIPISTNTNTITYLGRLEVRKGVIDLAKAIPDVVQKFPNVKFRLVGPSDVSPKYKRTMEEYLKKILKEYSHSVEFVGAVTQKEIPKILSAADVCIFPSIWENFPLVCLESMAAGRAIVASNAGGMSDMLEDGISGKLIPPNNPGQIANALIELLNNKKLRMDLGKAARCRLLEEYNTSKIGLLQEESYIRAINRRKASGSRH